MATIPASAIVNVIPNVLSAGGNALDLIAIVLTLNTRVPIGTAQAFPSALQVAKYFGSSAAEATIAPNYFNGFLLATAQPGSILYSQFPQTAVSAYLRGGNVASITLSQLQAITGSLTVVIDGYTHTYASVNLAAASSFSAAAALLQAGLTAAEPTPAVGTASIAPGAATSVTASISGYIMTVTAVGSGAIVNGAVLSGTGVTATTTVANQLSGVTGGIGTYAVSILQNTPSTTITVTYGVMTVTAMTSGTFSVGQLITGTGVTAGTVLTQLGTGTGLTGTYFVTPSGTTASASLTGNAQGPSVTFDSVSGGFLISSVITGAPSTSAFATGTAAAPLFLTQQTGAVLSQGSAALLPGTHMNNLIQLTQNWATFMSVFDPDNGATLGNTQKQLFSAWVNSTNNRYAYVAWDTDITPTIGSAPASLGGVLQSINSSGTCIIYTPTGDITLPAFACGYVASLNFQAVNGRATMAFKSQTGLVASVTNQTVAANLISNGYNYFGAYATANQQFLFMYPGSISGPFLWMDSYVNQIWLNNQFQLALMNLLVSVPSIPYNSAGYALIDAAVQGVIKQGLNFGAFRAGVTLSTTQVAAVNNAAGLTISDVLQQRGWYFQVVDATPQVRQARTTPPCNFWYMDGQSVQQITLNSINVQ